MYAVGVALLTCALLHANPEYPKIVQVTETHNHLLATATEHHFKNFMQEYGKEYSTHEEYVHRLGIFAKNLIRAAEHQAMDPTAVHGVTQFSDLSEEEFERMYMGVKGGGGTGGAAPWANGGNGVPVAPEIDVSGLPESFDWREKGAVTGVKMQVSGCLSSYFNLFIN